ncbi:MAG: glycosyltransferase [Candidatus Eisenbacteria bacterium]|nr:glycosyltransferase [Candidatus Eisenbacteria bacterium]
MEERGRAKEPVFSVVVPAYNAAERIGAVVRAAGGQRGLRGETEVIVVDDGSSDGTAVEAADAGARVIRQENSGPAAARNRGWREAAGDPIFFTDSDCYPAPDWAARLSALLREEGAGAAGGSYDAANGDSLLAACVQEEIALRHRRMGREVRFLGSYNLAVPRRVLEETGGFDESYRRASGEDNDLSYRIRETGRRLLFDPEARVAHEHPERLGRYLKEQARHGYWRMKLYREHPEKMSGDDYSGFADFIEPPSALLALASIPFLAWGPARLLFALSAGTLLLTAALPTAAILRRKGDPRLAAFLPVRFLRSFARGIGMSAGVARFWIGAGRRGGEG